MTETESNIIDPTALDNLLETVGGDQEFLAELIDTYLEDSPQQLATMQKALETGDADELRRAAHSLKSNSANFGANSLAKMCLEMEELGQAGALESAASRLAQIMVEYQKVRQALEEMRA